MKKNLKLQNWKCRVSENNKLYKVRTGGYHKNLITAQTLIFTKNPWNLVHLQKTNDSSVHSTRSSSCSCARFLALPQFDENYDVLLFLWPTDLYHNAFGFQKSTRCVVEEAVFMQGKALNPVAWSERRNASRKHNDLSKSFPCYS